MDVTPITVHDDQSEELDKPLDLEHRLLAETPPDPVKNESDESTETTSNPIVKGYDPSQPKLEDAISDYPVQDLGKLDTKPETPTYNTVVEPSNVVVGNSSDALPPPPINQMPTPLPPPAYTAAPAPVVPAVSPPSNAPTESYTTFGVEYLIMLISLATVAGSLYGLLNSIINIVSTKPWQSITSYLSSSSESALIVALPIFVFLFLRLESKEEKNKILLSDTIRRRSIQITLVISFLFTIGTLIDYLNNLLGGTLVSGPNNSGLAAFLHDFTGFIISGSIFAYYWFKLHKKTEKKII